MTSRCILVVACPALVTTYTPALHLFLLLSLLITSWLVVPNALGQGRPPMDPEARLDHMMENLTTHLTLTKEQSKQIRPLLAAQFEEQRKLFESLREQGPDVMAEARPQLMKLEQQTDVTIEALLTEEQVTAYRQYRKEQQQRRPTGPPRGGQ